MDKNINETIKTAGLDEKEIEVYLALLQMGGGTASQASKKSGVERVNTYYVLEQLIRKGFAYEAQKEGKKAFMAVSPKKFEMQAESNLKQIQSLIPELLSMENSNQTKPKIRYYEGIEGIKQVFEETLELPAGTETLAYSAVEEIHEYLKEWVAEYLKRRVACGISQRAILEDSDQARVHKLNDEAEMRISRVVPKERFPFRNQFGIYGNKVIIVSYRDLMGVVIESDVVAETQRAIFELAWEGAERYSSK